MIPENWVRLDVRMCARGYSVVLLQGLHLTHDRPYVITLNLDGLPYWAYDNLTITEATPAMDDLEMSPGPRGDSSWLAVLERCRSGENSPTGLKSPVVLKDLAKTSIGTWEWVQQIRADRENNIDQRN